MRISDWSSDVCSSDLVWALADPEGSQSLKQIAPGMALLGFSTDLGIAVVSSCENFFSRIDEPIHLIITSPPYPLAKPRRYGNVTEAQYVDWLCKTLEPVIKLLVRSEEHTSELQSLMRISYAVFCLKKKNTHTAAHY